ncbi:MAG: hypothetical protein EXQ56_03760 [Acidobacteria bacterium]|nr:hypothetical protein [Acidobacteriota bacterium]
MGRLLLPVALLLIALPAPLRPQAPDATSSNGKLITHARFTDAKITIDGKPDEPAWQTAELITGLVQKEPEEGQPPTEKTEFRVLYDKEFLYVAAWCHDRTKNGVIINDLGHDFDIQEQDYIAVILDTFNDDRNGYYLGATVLGNQRDIQFFSEGRNQNVNWDGVWYSEGQFTDDGYTVEMAIPFNTLRFSRQKEQVWGAQFVRRIRRRNEVSFWSPLPRRHTGISGIAMAGELRGIENVEPGRNFYVKPFALAGVTRFASRDEKTKFDPDGGVDLKYGLTPGLSLDLTVNTDFSHVEADTQQVNLTRFPLFFAEKREFFLENAGIFQFGSLTNEEALLFHSRTIGLAGGQPVPILGGARLTGRAGEYYLGLLNMQTRSDAAVPATNFSVARLRRNVFQNSDVGLMFLNRRSGLDQDHNRALGADGNLLFLRNTLRFSGALAQTWTPEREGDNRLGKAEVDYNTNIFRASGSVVDIGRNFNPEMGFVRRRDRRNLRNFLELKPRLNTQSRIGRYVRDVFVSNLTQHILFGEGGTETKYMLSQVRLNFQDGSDFGAHYEQNFERLRQPFEVSRAVILPARDYHFNESKAWFFSDTSKPLSGKLEYVWARFYSGDRTEITASAQYRPTYRLSTIVSLERNDIDLPEGAFVTNLLGFRADYSFSARMFLNSFVQYNSETDTISSNLRYRFIYRPLSDIYVVYNDVRDRRRSLNDWSMTVKYTRLWSF